ncbi:MAG: hypothetical protein RL681_676 [Candidatus Parcubacteria bacterium]|jgi:hypothetical protein
MNSDLAKLGQTGGSTPQGDLVSIRFTRGGKGALSTTISDGPASAAAAATVSGAGSNKKLILWIGIGTAGFLVLFLLGYFVLPAIFSGGDAGDGKQADKPPQDGKLPDGGTKDVFLGHHSFFRVAADQTVQGNVESLSPSVDASFYELIMKAVASVAPETSLVEVEAINAEEHAVSWVEFLSRRGVDLLSPEFFNEKFEQDFTLFLYRGTAGWRPGYILRLRRGEQAVTLRNALRALENDPIALSRLFAEPPGRVTGTFNDQQIAGQPVRTLIFSASDSTFVYGWFFNNYLIFGTSLDGVKKAVSQL